MQTEGLVKGRVQLPGYEKYGPEPSIHEFINRYYAQYFTPEESAELTEKYIKEWSKKLNS